MTGLHVREVPDEYLLPQPEMFDNVSTTGFAAAVILVNSDE